MQFGHFSYEIQILINFGRKITLLNQHLYMSILILGFPDSSVGIQPTCNAGDPVGFLGQEDPLKKG